MKRLYPTNPGVARWGVIALAVSLRKSVLNTVGSLGPVGPGLPRVPKTQKNLPALSCPGTWHICMPSVDPGRCPSVFSSFVQGRSLLSVPLEHPQ